MKVPFVDLRAQYESIKGEIDAAIKRIVESCAFIGGDAVSEFEAAFAKASRANYCVAVGNGTDAIYITLRMLGIGEGDEVITVANSWISTSEAISQTGASPVFVDVDEYFNIDVTQVESKITKRTRALLPVHLFGQPADITDLHSLAEKHGLMLVEDCAQAHLATMNGRAVGTFGRAGTFSFYPGKNLGAYGDAGCIITDDSDLAASVRKFANHGAATKHAHVMEGINSRLDGLQAAILGAKLPHLATWTRQRQTRADRYSELLQGIDEVSRPKLAPNRSHSFHLYVVLAEERDALRHFLADRGIATGIHYPSPLPLLPAYSRFDHRPSNFPRSYSNSSRMLSLPLYPELEDEQQDYVVGAIGEFYTSR